MTTGIFWILVLAMLYGLLNGLHGSASIVATIISSRALGPRQALILAAIGMTLGPLLLGVAVANTIGAELIENDAATAQVIIAGMLGAVLWSALAFWLRIPTSISQALIGGLVGAVWAGYGLEAVRPGGLNKTLIALFLSPLLGLVVGFLAVRLSYIASASATPHINKWFKRGQVLLSVIMAVAFGANDGQKIMGIVTLGLVTTGMLNVFHVPLWVAVFSAVIMGIGTVIGGWRLIHTLGGKFYKIRPIHGFGAQFASGGVILAAALLGGPVSGSQVITSAIVGAGSADRLQMVRWGVARQILISWLLTLPLSALVGAAAYKIVERMVG